MCAAGGAYSWQPADCCRPAGICCCCRALHQSPSGSGHCAGCRPVRSVCCLLLFRPPPPFLPPPPAPPPFSRPPPLPPCPSCSQVSLLLLLCLLTHVMSYCIAAHGKMLDCCLRQSTALLLMTSYCTATYGTTLHRFYGKTLCCY